MQTDAVIDFAEAISSLDGDQEAYREIAGIFLEETAPMLESLRRAAGLDADAMVSVLHEVASSLGAIGAMTASRSVRAMETKLFMRRGGDLLDMASEAARLTLDAASALDCWLARR
jgi:HPt (histidine-containing phosphotransfer) domain-containing protein